MVCPFGRYWQLESSERVVGSDSRSSTQRSSLELKAVLAFSGMWSHRVV